MHVSCEYDRLNGTYKKSALKHHFSDKICCPPPSGAGKQGKHTNTYQVQRMHVVRTAVLEMTKSAKEETSNKLLAFAYQAPGTHYLVHTTIL